VIKQLQEEKELRKQDQLNHDIKFKQLLGERSSQIYFSPKTEVERSRAVREDQYTPERRSSPSKGYISRYETPIGDLLDVRHTEPTKDQIHRLNSYLIENTTALKLLIEKHNYLLKLRGMG
jgi:hypothetical protein